MEVSEELRALQTAYDKLLQDYNNVLKIEKEKIEKKQIASIVVLRDKLMAKDNEIEKLRRQINELEKRVLELDPVSSRFSK